MSAPVAILNTGFVSSVGLSAPAACAAIRANLSNPSETRFIASSGEWIQAHQVPLERAWLGLERLARMAAMAANECLANVRRDEWPQMPLLLCIAEPERPGRIEGLEELLFAELQQELGTEFAYSSVIVPHGRPSVAIALRHAREMILEDSAPRALIVAADSLLTRQTLAAYDGDDRLLTPRSSDGFMPGEGAAALLIGADPAGPSLGCLGLGFANEAATIGSEQPQRGDGLSQAIRKALDDAGCALHDLDFRVTDLSGEQYYFKEAALALARLLRVHKEAFDLWHPAESIGETGAVAGVAALVVAHAACRKGYAPGPGLLCHFGNDQGLRAALVLRYRGN